MTTQTTTRTGYRGNGTAVHVVYVPAEGPAYAACFASANMTYGRNAQRITLAPEGTPVTCRSCRPQAATEAPAVTEHPERCPDHDAAQYGDDRQIKAGNKRTWNCGCTHLVKG